MRPNLGFYIQNINKIVQDTEEIGDTLNPQYEEVRQAIDADKVNELTAEKLAAIVDTFEKGTAKYVAMYTQVSKLRPPAQVLGIHKKFENSYKMYVEGCQAMIASLANGQVDVEAFNTSEKIQDEATDGISFSIQRMTSLLLKR